MASSGAPALPQHVHLMGIGGAGLSAIARVLAMRGHRVTGSDLRSSPITQALGALGIATYEGHAAEHVDGAELVVVSSAVPEDNPEVVAARAAGQPVLRRQELMPRLMAGHKGVAVAGTHGKTTTTGMLAYILERAGAHRRISSGACCLISARMRAWARGRTLSSRPTSTMACSRLRPMWRSSPTSRWTTPTVTRT